MNYFEQETHYTCAVACFRMMLDHFGMPVPAEADLAAQLGTNDVVGTHPDALVALGKEYGLCVSSGENGDLDTLQAVVDAGGVVMLMISVDVPHIVVFLGHNGNHVRFNDPYFGEDMSRQIKNFVSEKQKYPHFRWRIKQADFWKYLPAQHDFTDQESTRGYIVFTKTLLAKLV